MACLSLLSELKKKHLLLVGWWVGCGTVLPLRRETLLLGRYWCVTVTSHERGEKSSYYDSTAKRRNEWGGGGG